MIGGYHLPQDVRMCVFLSPLRFGAQSALLRSRLIDRFQETTFHTLASDANAKSDS